MIHRPAPSPSLFDAPRPVAPVDPNLAPAKLAKVTGDNARVLDRLREGPITAADVWHFTQRLAARVCDLKRAGYVIESERVEGGVARYRLVEERRP